MAIGGVASTSTGSTGDDHALLLAERDGEPIGYAVVSIDGGATTWALGETTAEIETLSVLDSERGDGVGADADRARGARSPARAAPRRSWSRPRTRTTDALRFYGREGFSDFYVLLTRPL